MPYSVPSSTKILIYFGNSTSFVLVGPLSVFEFAMVPVSPGRKGTLFFLHIQLHNH